MGEGENDEKNTTGIGCDSGSGDDRRRSPGHGRSGASVQPAKHGNPPGFDASAGWSLKTNQAITVAALDAFDPTGNGTAGAVRLYNASGTVLASATVTTSDPKEGSPISFYSHAISPV